MDMAAILVMWPGLFEYFRSTVLKSIHMKFEFNWPSGFRWQCLKMLAEDKPMEDRVIGTLLAVVSLQLMLAEKQAGIIIWYLPFGINDFTVKPV